MDVSARQQEDPWVNQALDIPAVPASRRDYYSFSKGTALVYRLKLASLLLLVTACALWRPDLRLPLLLNCWLLFLTCEAAHRNYPWREPLTSWLWRVRWGVPYSEALLCSALLLLWSQSGQQMPRPLVASFVCWSCGMLAWPLVRERWHRVEIKEVNYDQFSAIRPRVLTLPRSLELVLTTLQSPSLVVPLVVGVSSSIAAPFLPWWAAAGAGAVVLGCLALVCCHSLPDSIEVTRDQWAAQEAEHARKIAEELSRVQNLLRKLGQPLEGGSFFNQMCVQVPLLQREAALLLRTGRTLDDAKVRQMEEFLADPQLRQLGERLEKFGPYTTRCCVS